MKIFVFAVGGTGARMLRSLTMLLASGCRMPQDTTVVPIILDYDLTNGDTRLAKTAMEGYQLVRKKVYKESGYLDDSFFATPLVRLDQIPVAGGGRPKINPDFQVSVEGNSDSFGNYIGYSLLTHHEDAGRDLSLTGNLLDALYNNDPNSPGREIHLRLDKGFKGNPNIGSVVFDRWLQSEEFRFFEDSVAQDDRIFIVSSVFGGTGAAGFPKLVEAIHSSNKQFVRNAKIGACVVMPYFKFPDSEQSAITASIFNTKTKAALNYYDSCQLNKKLDALYYLSDRDSDADGLYRNEEGGSGQRNDAHVVELLAATSLVDFANKGEHELRSEAYEFGLMKEMTPSIDISCFDQRSKERYLDDLTRFTYFLKYFKSILPNAGRSEAYAVGLDLLGGKWSRDFYRDLGDFLEEYRRWLWELSHNMMRKFNAYNLGETSAQEERDIRDGGGDMSKCYNVPARELLTHKVLKSSFLRPAPLRDGTFHEYMGAAFHEKGADSKSKELIFMEIARVAMSRALTYAEKY